MHIQLAWRNIWRNPRRTTVILTAVVIGIWSMIFLGALSRGMMTGMIDNGISTLTGDIQIHHKGYRKDPVIENNMTNPSILKKVLQDTLPQGSQWTARIRVNAVANNARHYSGVTMVGIDPAQEAKVSFIGPERIQGKYLDSMDHHGIVIGRELLEKFETKIGKKLVLMSQDTNQEIASRAFKIIGTYTAEMKATEKQFVFITMPAAEKMLKLKNNISEISIILPEKHNNSKVASDIKGALSSTDYEVHTWQELLPILTAYLEMFDQFMYIWFVIVFIAMGFGIVNTTLMAVFERMREFGLLKALGMKPWWIVRSVIYESVLLLVMGMAIGNILAFACIQALSKKGIDLSYLAEGADYFGINRIIFPDIFFQDVFVANFVVIVLGIMVSIYPAARAARFTPVEALAHT